jgi:hypothetical protein
MIIYGAGMSGLLAATMLRRFDPVVHEAAAELPNNHAALLRFRSDAVSKATGIPFKKVWVQKAVMGEDGKLQNYASIKDQNCYSLKVSGEVRSRSIGNLESGERFIAPEDFISQLAKGIDIEYNKPLDKHAIDFSDKKTPTISTIPMNALMRIAGWSDAPDFKYNEITTVTAEISAPSVDIYQTIYYPYIKNSAYRASITGNKIIIEFVGDREDILCMQEFDKELLISNYLQDFIKDSSLQLSDIKIKKQKYGKLVNSTGKLGKEFILAMTDIYGIYSLGRFATWRQILMDDVVHDVKIIEKLIEQRDNYSRRLRIV